MDRIDFEAVAVFGMLDQALEVRPTVSILHYQAGLTSRQPSGIASEMAVGTLRSRRRQLNPRNVPFQANSRSRGKTWA